ncbi:MAG: hypothetical protein E1N59_574 [Puniceicoccaceae bacterium 5H]|nr:MAG: hypothetical protein E1N59_574 [Puniceicoccaceae bacterium 5H]
MKRRLAFTLSCVALAVLAGCGDRQREQVVEALPPTPDLSDARPALVRQISTAEEAVHKAKQPLEGYALLTKTYHANGFLSETIQGYAFLQEAEPDNPHWPHLLAFIIAGYGDLEAALPLWDRVVELAPDYLPARIRRADALLKLNRLEEAEAAYRAVLEHDAENPYASVGLARLAIADDDYPQARKLLLDAASNSHNRIGVDLLVTVFEHLGEDDKARYLRRQAKAGGTFTDIPDPWLNQLMDLCVDPYQLVSAGGFAAFSGDNERGIELMQRALRFEPDNALAHFQLGDMYRDTGQTDKALAEYRRARELKPEFADPWLREIELLRSSENSTAAADDLLFKALDAAPQSPALYQQLGQYHTRRGNLEAASSAYRDAIAIRPNEPEAYIQLANIFLRQGRIDAAQQTLEQALEAEPGNPFALSTLAMIAISRQDRAEADRYLQAVHQQPRTPANLVEKLHANYRNTFGQEP